MPWAVLRNTRIGMAVKPALMAPQCQGYEEESAMIETFHTMQAKLEATPHLLRLGRLFSENVLVQVGDDEIYLTFDKGHLTHVTAGPSRKTPWRFALRTDAEALAQFWQPLPAPGFHDIFGLLKVGRGNIDGDILCLVKNLRFFKEFMALPRTKREDAA
ncbi:hypothetical protein [Sulfitobacter pontiacus]|jgi:hypothetical protein